MKTLTALTLSMTLLAGTAWASANPEGLWRTIDDATKEERSLVRISQADGVLVGVVEKILNPERAERVCDKCTDERKDQKIQGMTILRGVKHNASNKDIWDGGDILDAENGKIYKVRLKPIDGGQRLEVRGYIGAPLLGRTQTWIRVE
jgi:uncharacterized protein (DUF2147 family)